MPEALATKSVKEKNAETRNRQSQERMTLYNPSDFEAEILNLHSTFGNRAVGRILQAKLVVGPPGDRYEREADWAAEQVMRTPEQGIARISKSSTTIHRKCTEFVNSNSLCPKCAEEEGIQRKPLAATLTPLRQRRSAEPTSQTLLATPQIAAHMNALRGSGQPLSPSVRDFFEPRFGADFSGVQVHTNERAVQFAQSVNAQAFTIGQDVVFGAGHYSPETNHGRQLLAHELTHVLQQGKARTIKFKGTLSKDLVTTTLLAQLLRRAVVRLMSEQVRYHCATFPCFISSSSLLIAQALRMA